MDIDEEDNSANFNMDFDDSVLVDSLSLLSTSQVPVTSAAGVAVATDDDLPDSEEPEKEQSAPASFTFTPVPEFPTTFFDPTNRPPEFTDLINAHTLGQATKDTAQEISTSSPGATVSAPGATVSSTQTASPPAPKSKNMATSRFKKVSGPAIGENRAVDEFGDFPHHAAATPVATTNKSTALTASTDNKVPNTSSPTPKPVEATPHSPIAVPTPNASAKSKGPNKAATAASRAKGTNKSVANGLMPDWLKQSIKTLERVSSGPEWNALLKAFSDHERVSGYHVGAMWGLSWEGAPQELEWWWGRGRQNLKNSPGIEDGKAFGKTLIKYWTSLQPSWRGPGLSKNVPNDHVWATYAVPGPNGLFLIIVCISWWIRVLDGSDHAKFFGLLDDVTWVLTQSSDKLMNPGSAVTRRGPAEMINEGSNSGRNPHAKKRVSASTSSASKRRRA